MCAILNIIALQMFKSASDTIEILASWTQPISEMSAVLAAMFQMTNSDIQMVMRDVNYHRAFLFNSLKEGLKWGAVGKPCCDHCME